MSLTAFKIEAQNAIQPVSSQSPLPVTNPGLSASAVDSTGALKNPVYTFLGHQLGLTIDTSTALTVPAGTRYAVVQCTTQAARYRYDGSTTPPTSSVGMTISAGGELALDVGKVGMDAMRFISQTAGAILNVAYFS